MTRSPYGDAGETLVEVLISLVVVGLAVAALLGAVLVGSELSAAHRDDARADLDLRTVAEQVKAAGWSSNPNSVTYSPAQSGPVRCWSPALGAVQDPPSWSPCDGTNDHGMQFITLAAQVDGRRETVQVVKRRQP